MAKLAEYPSKAKFSKRHYESIADLFSLYYRQGTNVSIDLDTLIYQFIVMLEEDNENFDRTRFITWIQKKSMELRA